MSMHRILLVDDEFLVRLGLKTTIDWAEHGYIIVGEASNGAEALEMVNSSPPDIVLTDIKMPRIDGLELIQRIREINKNIAFIILSNYEDFQYAKKAMNLGVSQYLLKTEINADTLLEALQYVTKKRGREDTYYFTRAKIEEDYLCRSLARDQINKCISIEHTELPPEGTFLESPYAVVKYFCDISFMNEKSLGMLSKTMISLVENEFSNVAYSEVVYQMHYYITLIFSTKGQAHHKSVWKEKSNMIARKLKYYFSVSLKGGMSNTSHRENIPRMLWEAECARQESFFEDCHFNQYREPKNENISQEKIHVSTNTIHKLIEKRNGEELREYIVSIFKQVKAQKSYLDFKHVFIDFLSIAKSNQEEGRYKESLRQKIDYDSWNAMSSLEHAQEYIFGIFSEIISREDKNGGYSQVVKRTIAYIEENYSKNITLEDVAQNVALSKSYLSMLFKQETGINFITYLNDYRIDNAKLLLTKTNLKIYEIAEKVGFYSPYYFSKIFKEVTKMHCKEYRDEHSL